MCAIPPIGAEARSSCDINKVGWAMLKRFPTSAPIDKQLASLCLPDHRRQVASRAPCQNHHDVAQRVPAQCQYRGLVQHGCTILHEYSDCGVLNKPDLVPEMLTMSSSACSSFLSPLSVSASARIKESSLASASNNIVRVEYDGGFPVIRWLVLARRLPRQCIAVPKPSSQGIVFGV